jgi:hypothetical protein
MMREWFGWLCRNSAASSAITAKRSHERHTLPKSNVRPGVLQLEDRLVPSGFAFVGNESQLASAITAANQGGNNPTIIDLTSNIALTQALPTITGSMSIWGNGHTLGSAPGASGRLGFGVLDIEGTPGAGTIPTVALSGLTIEGGSACNGGGVYASNANLQLISDAFKNCSATGSGGGVAFTDPAVATSLQVNSCTFTNNCALGSGGAIAFIGANYGGQSLAVVATNFTGNVAQWGGGISFTSVLSAGMVNLNSCNFSGDVSRANLSITDPTKLDGAGVDADCAAFVMAGGTFSGGANLNVRAQEILISWTTFNGGTSVYNPVCGGFSTLTMNANFINGADWYWDGVLGAQGTVYC